MQIDTQGRAAGSAAKENSFLTAAYLQAMTYEIKMIKIVFFEFTNTQNKPSLAFSPKAENL